MSSGILGLFPGQGSQKVGMGKELFETAEIAREIFDIADKVLGFPLSKLCFEGPAEELTATAVAQPAILTVSTIAYSLAAKENPGLTLVAGAGHSLGEYSALVSAEALTFSDAVSLVNKRGRYMQEAVPRGRGKMIAVLGKELPELEDVLSNVKHGVAQIANVNAPGQIVIAGDAAAVDEFTKLLPGAKIIELPVSAPFHCSLMKRAEESLAKDLAAISFKQCKFPVYANFTGRAVREPEEVRASLKNQVCGRVRWTECMTNSIAETTPSLSVEFGAGNVLAGLLKRIDPSLARKSVGSLAEAQALFRS